MPSAERDLVGKQRWSSSIEHVTKLDDSIELAAVHGQRFAGPRPT